MFCRNYEHEISLCCNCSHWALSHLSPSPLPHHSRNYFSCETGRWCWWTCTHQHVLFYTVFASVRLAQSNIQYKTLPCVSETESNVTVRIIHATNNSYEFYVHFGPRRPNSVQQSITDLQSFSLQLVSSSLSLIHSILELRVTHIVFWQDISIVLGLSWTTESNSFLDYSPTDLSTFPTTYHQSLSLTTLSLVWLHSQHCVLGWNREDWQAETNAYEQHDTSLFIIWLLSDATDTQTSWRRAFIFGSNVGVFLVYTILKYE